jgi:hypothetical protein
MQRLNTLVGLRRRQIAWHQRCSGKGRGSVLQVGDFFTRMRGVLIDAFLEGLGRDRRVPIVMHRLAVLTKRTASEPADRCPPEGTFCSRSLKGDR